MSNKRQKHILKAEGGKDVALALKRYGQVRVIPLGIFTVRNTKGRMLHDFRSGKMKKQRPSKIVTFKPSKPLKDFIKGNRKNI